MWWVVNATPQPLYPQEIPGTNCMGGWPVWTGEENLAPTGIQFPDRPTHSQSLHRLSYPGARTHIHIYIYVCMYIYIRLKLFLFKFGPAHVSVYPHLPFLPMFLHLHLVLAHQCTRSVIYIAQRLAISEGRILKTQYHLYLCGFRN
jgi:hypothetical protein